MENNRYYNNETQSKNQLNSISEKSSKLWLIPVIVIVFLAAIGIFMYFSLKDGETVQDTTLPGTQQNAQSSSVVTNCGANMNCLIDASKNCELAKLTDNTTVELFGMFITTTTFYEIKGAESNKCVLYLRTENQDVDFSSELVQQMLDGGATLEQIEQQKQEANKQAELVEGLDGTCKFNNNSDLTSLLSKLKSGTFSGSVSCDLTLSGSDCTSTGDWSVADCSGEMFEGTN